MAKYTIELRNLFETGRFNPPLYTRNEVEGWFKDYNLYDFLTKTQVQTIEKAGIWNKDKLAKLIVDHYYMYEIGQETPALFKHFAKVKMQELMEEYLPLIYSASIEYDPLINVDYKETFEKENTDNLESTSKNSGLSNTNSKGINLHSDTPQNRVSKEDILGGRYVSDTEGNELESINDFTSDLSNNSKTTGKENYIKHIIGNSGTLSTAQKLIEQYRNNIRAINREIIEKLDVLFIGLW